MTTNNFNAMKKAILLLFLSLIFSGMFPSQLMGQDITGKWHGLIKFPGSSLRLDLEIMQQNGEYKATAFSPDQGNNSIPIDEFSYTDGKMKFAIHRLDVKYSGKMDKASSTIKGIFEQHGQMLPLDLGRQFIEVSKGNSTGPDHK